MPYYPPSSGTISIVTSDPVSPTVGQTWILQQFASGLAMGALGMTYNGHYLLSTYTTEGIKRTPIIY